MTQTFSKKPSLLKSGMCTQAQLSSKTFQNWATHLGEAPQHMHRKIWEWCFIAQALSERGLLRPGSRGLGFAVGQEPLTALFANYGCNIVATDLFEEAAKEAGWVDTNQHASAFDIDRLNVRGLCPPKRFRDRVTFRYADMNNIPNDLRGFDFLWSACALEHLGSISHGREFIHNAMECLKPGGIAVHTTEFNISSNTSTIRQGPVVLYRKQDIEKIVEEIEQRKHHIELDLSEGEGYADQIIDLPPYNHEIHLRVQLGNYTITSLALIIQKQLPQKNPKDLVKQVYYAGTKIYPLVTHNLERLFDRNAISSESSNKNLTNLIHQGYKGIIFAGYRGILKREPDETGLERFLSEMTVGRMTASQFLESLLNSEEYKNKLQNKAFEPMEALHAARMMMVRQLPSAETIVDLGGAAAGHEEGALIFMGYPYAFQRLTIVEPPQALRHEIYKQVCSDQLVEVQTASGPVTYCFSPMTNLEMIPSQSIDLVYSGESVEHITQDELESTLQEIRRVLKPGGDFCFDTPNRSVTRIQVPNAYINPDHKYEYTCDEIRTILSKHNFEIIEAKGITWMPKTVKTGQFDIDEMMTNIGLYDDLENCYLVYFRCRPKNA